MLTTLGHNIPGVARHKYCTELSVSRLLNDLFITCKTDIAFLAPLPHWWVLLHNDFCSSWSKLCRYSDCEEPGHLFRCDIWDCLGILCLPLSVLCI